MTQKLEYAELEDRLEMAQVGMAADSRCFIGDGSTTTQK